MIDWRNIIIKRTKGPYPKNRYGIILKNLAKAHRKFLVENRYIKRWAGDDQFIECIIKMQKAPLRDSSSARLYYDWENHTPVTQSQLVENYNTVDWKCAISDKPIKAKFMNFDLENFVHSDYLDILKAPMVDSRILKSSIEFRKKCKELLLEQRQEFLRIAKKNAKRRLQ
jgi:hypothetical protein